MQAVLDALRTVRCDGIALELETPIASDEHLTSVLSWIHEPAYLQSLLNPEAGEAWDGGDDNPLTPGTPRAVLSAAGVTLAAALELCNQRLQRGFLPLRPPGNMAARDRARGFSYCATAALAAEVVARAWQLPVLIVDIDNYHGAGTQERFYDRADVAYLSVHEYPGLSATGAGDEIGEGDGRGATRNIPLAPGADDAVLATAVENGLEEMTARIRPAALVVSVGFGSHLEDPLGRMCATEAGFARIGRAIVDAANTWTEGRIIALLEGGFNPTVLAKCASDFVRVLAEEATSAN